MVLSGIVITLALTCGAMALLFYRAMVMPEPSRVLVVHADSDWEGAELSIEGGALDQPQVTKFEQAGGYNVPFYLWPGKYTLRIRSQGTEVFRRDFDFTGPDKLEEFDLLRTGATTRAVSSSQPASNQASTLPSS